jgi:AraC-like DNA-binding protein
MSHLRHIRHTRHESESGCWELAAANPHPALLPYVREYVGGLERTAIPICRREIPSEIAPVVINFAACSRFFDKSDPTRWTDCGSFATGPHDAYVLAGSTGALNCVQINFTVLGARLFLDRPLRELTNRAVALEDLLGADAERLISELYESPTWEQRFAILDREIMRRFAAARQPAAPVVRTWQRLIESDGGVSIGSLVGEMSWSQKHLIAQFTDQMGLTPKVLARVLRFGRAIKLLKSGSQIPLVETAYACGYYDQSHFSRDFRAFAGVTPTELMRCQMPDSGGFSAAR